VDQIAKLFRILLVLSICMVVGFISNDSYAMKYENVLGLCDTQLYVTGFLRQKFEFGTHDPRFNAFYQLNGNTDLGASSFLTTAFLENQLLYGEHLEFRLGARWEGDWADSWHGSPTLWSNGDGLAWGKFSDEENVEADDSFRDIIREATVAIFSKYATIRAGKAQLGWGEGDGLRLMDAINPLDYRRSFIFRDSDEGYSESRIPLWMLRTDFTPDFTFGSQLGLQNLDLELSWIPDPRSAGNRFAVGPRTGGPWGFPLPDLPLPLTQLNLPTDNYPGWGPDDWSFAGRLKGIWHEIFFTINGFYGWSKSVTFGNSGLAGGNVGFVTDPRFIGNVADAMPGDIRPGLPPALQALPFPVYGLTLTLEKEVARQKFLGLTASRELPIGPVASWLGQKTFPVFRVEAMYDKDVAFNIGIPNKATTIFSDWIWQNTRKQKDVYRYLIGLDWDTHFNFINPGDKVWVSAQFSQNIIDGGVDVDEKSAANPAFGYPGGETQRLQYAPYFWFPRRTETFTSLLMNTAYFHNKLQPQVLWVADWTYHSYWIKGRVNYKLGDFWRFEVGAYYVQGNSEEQFGLFHDSDSIYTQVMYQF